MLQTFPLTSVHVQNVMNILCFIYKSGDRYGETLWNCWSCHHYKKATEMLQDLPALHGLTHCVMPYGDMDLGQHWLR